MKRKRFYNNKKRNDKWTEEPQGRKISFADKYTDGETNELLNPKGRKRTRRIDGRKVLRNAIIVVLCFAIVSLGYIIMDVHIMRNSMPEEREEPVNNGVALVDISIRAKDVHPLSFDGGTMLNSVLQETAGAGYASIAFDLKRDDGTIGYQSALATIEAYGAISSPASDLKGSVDIIVQNDSLPVGRISVYRDNIAARADEANAITVNGSLYQDEDGFLYLNPDSEGTYNYIKSIVEEARGLGVTVFALSNCNLPEELGDGYSDGFENLSQRLYNDFGDEVKLVEAIDVEINSADYESIESEIYPFSTDKNKVYRITAKRPDRVKTVLDKSDINYIMV